MVYRDKLQALVLSRRSVGEADRLMTLFSREKGIIKVVAKGVRRIPSRRGGHGEPLTQVVALVTGSQGRFFLQAADTQQYFRPLHDDQEAVKGVQRVVHVMMNVLEEEAVYARLYDALLQACELWPSLPYAKRCLLETALVLLSLREAGVLPLLGRCQRCRTKIPSEAVVLDPGQGSWFCLSCLSVRRNSLSVMSRARSSLTPDMLKVLRYVSEYPEKALNISLSSEQAKQLVRAWREYVVSLTVPQAAILR